MRGPRLFLLLFVLCVLSALGVAAAPAYDGWLYAYPGGTFTYSSAFVVRVKNMGGGPMSVQVSDGAGGWTTASSVHPEVFSVPQLTSVTTRWMGPSPASAVAVGATSSIYVQLAVVAPSAWGTAKTQDWSFQGAKQVRVTIGSVSRVYNMPTGKVLQFRGDYSQSSSPNPLVLGQIDAFAPSPASTVTMTGWPAASASATVTGTGFFNIPVTLTSSGPASVSISNSDAVPDGSLIEVVVGGSVVGSGTVSKLPDGSFALTIPVAPPPAGGRVRVHVTEGKDYAKSVKLYVPPVSGPPSPVGTYGLTRSSPIDWTTDDAAAYTDHGYVEVRDVEGGKILARAPMVKASDGSFDIILTIDGSSEPDVFGDNLAAFELDLVNYRDEARTVELQVFNGSGWVTVRTANVQGGASGIRKLITQQMDNSSGQWSNRQYRWKTGETVLASGTTPAPVSSYDSEGHLVMEYGFKVGNIGTIGYTREEVEERELEEAERDTDGDGVPDLEDFPGEPPDGTPADTDGDGVPDGRAEDTATMKRGETFDDMAAAVKKALDAPGSGGRVGNTQPLKDDSQEKLGKLLDGTRGLKGLVDSVSASIFANGEGLRVNVTGQSYSLTIPTVPRATVLDLSPWSSTLSSIRAILAAIVTWYFAIYSIKVLRTSFT